MASAPYPLSPAPSRKSWLDRHAGWKIPLGCLAAVLLLAAFAALIITIVSSAFHNSDVFREAIARAERSRQVTDRIGTPLRPGWLPQGKIEVSGSTGTAQMAIPVTGPGGKATINLDARKIAGAWQFRTLQVQFEDSTSVNLLAAEGGTGVQ
ncbi:MAG: cytochrome c oxidase assembly factor Coa1 family protein [Terriglobales bacterium]